MRRDIMLLRLDHVDDGTARAPRSSPLDVVFERFAESEGVLLA